MGSNCLYCLSELSRKEYPSGQSEHDRRFLKRKYCDINCYSKGSAFMNAKNKYVYLKNERKEFINSYRKQGGA